MADPPGRGTTLMSDGDEHRTQREIVSRPLTRRALADLRPDAQAIADTLVGGAAVLSALVERVEIVELPGAPVRKRNNVIRSFASPPVSVTPKARP